MKSTQPSLVLIGLHDFLIFSNRTAHAWSVKAGNICSVSVSFVRVGSQISRRRAKKDSNIPSPGRTGSGKCPNPGPTKTNKSPPHALPPPPHPPAGFTLIGALLSKGRHWSSYTEHWIKPFQGIDPFMVYWTFDWAQLVKICPHGWKEHLKIIKFAKFEKDLLKINQDIVLQSC